MTYFTGFACVACRAEVAPEQDVLLCPACGNLLDATYDYDRLRRDVDRDGLAVRDSTVWRWHELLPVLDRDKVVTLGEGGTPLLRADRLARSMGIRELWLKSDATGNPTGSLKDRSITVSATKAREFGYPTLSCDSTGNKASSAAAYAARAGLRAVVFCPHDTPLPKVAQAIFFGAHLIRVRGHYSEINAMYRRLIGTGGLPGNHRRHRQSLPLRRQEDLRIRNRGRTRRARAGPGGPTRRRWDVGCEDLEGLQRTAPPRLVRRTAEDDGRAGGGLRADRAGLGTRRCSDHAGRENTHHRQCRRGCRSGLARPAGAGCGARVCRRGGCRD